MYVPGFVTSSVGETIFEFQYTGEFNVPGLRVIISPRQAVVSGPKSRFMGYSGLTCNESVKEKQWFLIVKKYFPGEVIIVWGNVSPLPQRYSLNPGGPFNYRRPFS